MPCEISLGDTHGTFITYGSNKCDHSCILIKLKNLFIYLFMCNIINKCNKFENIPNGFLFQLLFIFIKKQSRIT